MKTTMQKFLITLSIVGFVCTPLVAENDSQPLLAQKLHAPASTEKKRKSRKKDLQKNIVFQYDNEDLVDIIYNITAQKGVNVVLPQGANAINSKVTLYIEEKLTLDEAWSLLFTILDLAGYTLMPKGSLYIIVKNNPNSAREPLPLYIGTNPNSLPDTDQRIRYLYYLSNIKVSDDPSSEIVQILQNLLPQAGSPTYKVDPNTNSIILSTKSNDIRSVMKIIVELDRPDFQETLETIKLKHTSAKFVADLFNESLLKSNVDLNRYRLDAKQQTEAMFFSKFTRVIPDERTNSVFVLGRGQAIERIREFIEKYIDVELESGSSILHLYQLLYLDAPLTAQVLNEIIKASREGGTGQSTAGQVVGGGPQATFDEVYIRADKPMGEGAANFAGGNKLVIACTSKDWKVIERLLQELDKPQPQVLIEVLIADLSNEDVRQLGSMLRNPAAIPLPGTSNYQDAQISNILLSQNADQITPATTLQADLLRQAYDANGRPADPGTKSVADFLTPGSTAFSLNDNNGETWSIISLLKTFNASKILSHPHVIVANNKQAEINLTETRYLADEATSSGGTTTTIKKKNVPAALKVTITPRISYGDMVLIEVIVDVTNYVSSTIDSRNTRVVRTKALVKDKSILALGGLIQLNDTENIRQTPILGRIPIIGYFFKNRQSDAKESNLTIFLTPTIIEPRLRAGVDKYTKDYIDIAKRHDAECGLFDSLRDPITRWFFNQGAEADVMVDTFMAKDELKVDATEKERAQEIVQAQKPSNSSNKKRKRSVTTVVPIEPESRTAQLQKLIARDDSPLQKVDDQITV